MVELSAYDHAVHSGFLVHWTGKGIDAKFQNAWYQDDKSQTTAQSEEAYEKRLLDILQHGLWMTSESGLSWGATNVPATPKCCFTELKLSQSRRHAFQCGRLGIGVKRPFLFGRYGHPLAYFGFGGQSEDVLLDACGRDLKNKGLLNFFKPMNSGRTLNYDLYGESEWRILYLDELLEKGKIIDPRESKNVKSHEYFNSLSPADKERLKFLIPLDGWFAVVIYPSLQMKNWAQGAQSLVRSQITRIKSLPDHGNRVEGGNWPIEVHLDSCRHF